MRSRKRKTVWAYLDGKKLVDVVQAALDNKRSVRMSRDWTPEELQTAGKAMKASGHMSFEEFSASITEQAFKKLITKFAAERMKQSEISPEKFCRSLSGPSTKIRAFISEPCKARSNPSMNLSF